MSYRNFANITPALLKIPLLLFETGEISGDLMVKMHRTETPATNFNAAT
jgi:hypothetical protein